jgi:hypothetical protein
MTVEMPPLAVISILAVSSLVRGLFGFGDALVAMPLLALCLPLIAVRKRAYFFLRYFSNQPTIRLSTST